MCARGSGRSIAILVAAKIAGWIFGRLRQPEVLGELVAGVLIGPHALGLIGAPGLKLIARFHGEEPVPPPSLRLDSRLVYVVVGDGPNGEAMVDACRRRGLADHFRFVGWVDHEHMPAFLSLADIVVMMSEQETQALLYLEAQASGRVLLSSDVPGGAGSHRRRGDGRPVPEG